MAGDDEPKGLFDNGGTRPGVDLRFITIECVDVLVEEVGLEFLRANFFLMLPSILVPESRRGSEGEGSSLQVGPEWNGERTVINILLVWGKLLCVTGSNVVKRQSFTRVFNVMW